jgi:hypothetical protein
MAASSWNLLLSCAEAVTGPTAALGGAYPMRSAVALIGLLFGCFVQEGNKPHCNASSWLTSLLGFRRMTRRCPLGRLIGKADTPALQLSHAFNDGAKLLAECERRGLEGDVAKQTDQAYRSGRADHWIKVKTTSWKATNADRGQMFASGR